MSDWTGRIGDMYSTTYFPDAAGRDVFLTDMDRTSARQLAHAMRKNGVDAVIKRMAHVTGDLAYEVRLPIPVEDVRYLVFCEMIATPHPKNAWRLTSRTHLPRRAWERLLRRVVRVVRNPSALATLDTAWRMNAPVRAFRDLLQAYGEGREDDA